MVTVQKTFETTLTLRLSKQAQEKLVEQAANSGQDVATVASDLIERATTRPSIAQIMAPVLAQVAASGITDEQLDHLLHEELDAHRAEKKAKSA